MYRSNNIRTVCRAELVIFPNGGRKSKTNRHCSALIRCRKTNYFPQDYHGWWSHITVENCRLILKYRFENFVCLSLNSVSNENVVGGSGD